MRSAAVLVIAANEQRLCVQTLEGMGLMPLVRRDMEAALEKLRHEPFVAVCIDAGTERIDALECVLNIRDVDGQTPVLVIADGSCGVSVQQLAHQRNTYLLRQCSGLEEAIDSLLAEESARESGDHMG